MDKQAYKDMVSDYMVENNKLKKVLREVLDIAHIGYNWHDPTSMRMALGNIKSKIEEVDDKDN